MSNLDAARQALAYLTTQTLVNLHTSLGEYTALLNDATNDKDKKRYAKQLNETMEYIAKVNRDIAKRTAALELPQPVAVVKPVVKRPKATKCFYCDKKFAEPNIHIVLTHKDELEDARKNKKPLPVGFSHY